METIPVYLVVGFLEAGKTRFIQETMEDTRFHKGEKTLILLCEEGEEELDPTKYTGGHVTIETLDDEEDLTREKLESLHKKYGFERVVLEYNGMWPIARLMEQMPENWQIYQCMMMADANTFLTYNQNMRGLMVDKLQLCELCVLNRASDSVDKEAIHKVIRGVSRRTWSMTKRKTRCRLIWMLRLSKFRIVILRCGIAMPAKSRKSTRAKPCNLPVWYANRKNCPRARLSPAALS